jgi:acyl-coenzyme A thioesterase PaaI-like protein
MKTVKLFNKLKKYPAGKTIFSILVSRAAPYFTSIKPRFVDLRVGYCEASMQDRKKVRNHIGTVHAIAMCNLAEVCGGLAVDASMPKHLRWIPKGMTVRYEKKAKGKLVGVCEFDPALIIPGDVIFPVIIKNPEGEQVFSADITFFISEKKKS